jgi:RNA polymerase sigma-70 factor, ECF subfamily
MNPPAPDSADTQELLEQAAQGDRRAFERLFARYRDYLRQIIEMRLEPQLRARVDASDVVQEAQLEAFRRLGDYLQRRPMPFRLWLRKTACERLLMLRRQHEAACRAVGREAALPEESSLQLARQLLASVSTPSQQAVREEVAEQVRRAVAGLSEPDREILLMRNVEGLSNQDAAAVLQINPVAASQRYGRALLRLRKLLIAAGVLEPQP